GGDVVLAPQDRIGFTPVRGKDRGTSLAGTVVDDGGHIAGAAVFQPCGDRRGTETLWRGDAHGFTPGVFNALAASKPTARFMDWIAVPAVPLTRLSMAHVTISRPASASTADWINAKFDPCVAPVSGWRPSGSWCTNCSCA